MPQAPSLCSRRFWSSGFLCWMAEWEGEGGDKWGTDAWCNERGCGRGGVEQWTAGVGRVGVGG